MWAALPFAVCDISGNNARLFNIIVAIGVMFCKCDMSHDRAGPVVDKENKNTSVLFTWCLRQTREIGSCCLGWHTLL